MQINIMSVKECQLIRGKRESRLSNAVYIIRYNGKVCYVGKTYRCVPRRIREHLNTGKYGWINREIEIHSYQPGETNLLDRERELIESLRPDENKI